MTPTAATTATPAPATAKAPPRDPFADDDSPRTGPLAFSWQLVRTAAKGLAAHKMRTFLTCLGVIIGVAAVLAMMAIAEGASQSVSSRIRNLGTNLIFVSPGHRRGRGPARSAAEDAVQLDDGEKILASCPSVSLVAPDLTRNAQVKYLSQNRPAQIVGTTPEYLECRSYGVAEGTFFDSDDVRAARLVCVLGYKVAEDLFGGGTPVGSRIKIQGRSFEVIGLMEEKGDASWVSLDERVYVPIKTAQKRLFGTDNVSQIIVQAADESLVGSAELECDAYMRARHRLGPEVEENELPYRIRSQREMLSTMSEVSNTFRYLFGGVALVSLLVGGIGIMNIMLVSVTERTREIGIRMAVGATRRDILLQFLVESVALSIVGGAIGLGVGAGITWALARFAAWEVVLPSSAIFLAIGFSVSIGIFFGLYPASKAARLDPIDALRYE